jgi:hypothetical protein
MQIEKFASEIFCHEAERFMLQRKMKSHMCAAGVPNRRRISTFRFGWRARFDVGGKFRINSA